MRFLRAVVVMLVVLLAFVYGFAKLTSDDGPRVATPRLDKGITALDIGTASKLRWSPDGRRLALVEDGTVTVVGIDDAKIVTRAGHNVVDATWMPDSKRVLVVEGPIPTGQIATLDMQGRLDGVATLAPSIAFGDGFGLAVDARGTRAAAIAVTRDAIGGATHSDLAVIELQTGKVHVYATPRNETTPVFVDDDLVAVASAGRLDRFDLTTGAAGAGPALSGGPFARTFGEEIVVARRAPKGATTLVAVDADTGDARTLHVTKPHRQVVAVNREVTRCLVRVPDPGGAAHLEIEAF